MKNNWSKYLSKNLITYMGNKRSLLNEIEAQIKDIKAIIGTSKISFADVFSGSGVVSRLAKKHSLDIQSNDLEYYSFIVNKSFLGNYSPNERKELKSSFEKLNKMIKNAPVYNGYIRKTYSPKKIDNIEVGERVFYTPKNAIIIDSAIKYIKTFEKKTADIMMAVLLAEASIHVNTTGVFKGFYKNSKTKKGQFGGNGKNSLKRIKSQIKLSCPTLTNTNAKISVSQLESHDFAQVMKRTDIVYLDPPYNQHPYGSNYFMLNLIAKDERPSKISKVSGIPEGWNRSRYNKAAYASEELFSLCAALKTSYIVISYNSEGFIKKEEFMKRLNEIGTITKITEIKYNTFRGSRNLSERSLHVKEYLFIVKKNN